MTGNRGICPVTYPQSPVTTLYFILSYLTEEVLRQLSPDLHTFLLQTSVLDRLTGPLCDAVTRRTDSDAVLADLYAANVFVIPLDDEHRWYRYHHLFADLLRSQLNRTQPDLAPILHGRASEWCARQGLAADAIEHVFAAQNTEEVVRLLEIHARPVVLQGYVQTVESWLRRLREARLPQSAWMAGPRANLAFAWSLLLRGQLDEIEPYLNAAEGAVDANQSLFAILKFLKICVQLFCNLCESVQSVINSLSAFPRSRLPKIAKMVYPLRRRIPAAPPISSAG